MPNTSIAPETIEWLQYRVSSGYYEVACRESWLRVQSGFGDITNTIT